MLWSIAAGPLVNLALFPILFGLYYFARIHGWRATMPDVYFLVRAVLSMDIGLFLFNILPVYPLDGGKIVWSLLWFLLGRAKSLLVATYIGFIGLIGFVGLAIWFRDGWLGAIAIYLFLNCWGGLQHARALLRFSKLPRHQGFACPACQAAPTIGEFWKCGQCGTAFDTFVTRGACPNCRTQFPVTRCMECGESRPIGEWAVPVISSSSTFTNEVKG